jgi:Tol biopolymer transport system component
MTSAPSLADRLDSWKEIAAFLGRGVRTVQRWEREEGLPVHRLAHDKRGSVYARREELSAWWESRRQTLASQPADEAPEEESVAPRVERVTRMASMTTWPALSSDARLIAYVSDGGQDGATPQIWVQQLGGAALQLTHGEFQYSNVSFAPGDTNLLFTAVDETGSNVYEIATLGGTPRVVQRGVRSARYSPDGEWLASIPKEAVGIRISARGGAGFRTIAPDLIDIASMTWVPDSRAVIVHAHPSPALEPDWWLVPIDGSPPTNTGVIRGLRPPVVFVLPTGAVCLDDTLVFSAASPQGVNLYQQRLTQPGCQPTGSPRQLTASNESAVMPTVARGKLAFISRREDANLWSLAIDASSGVARGPLRRLTRGPGILVCLSATRDSRTLFYSSVRFGEAAVFSRDLRTGAETTITAGPAGDRWYPAVSPSGSQLAFARRVLGGEKATRPIFLTRLEDGTSRLLGEDCGGRPREWIDERLLMIERFGPLNRIAVIDTETAEQYELVESAERSVTNARLSPDRGWIAFDASRPGTPADIFIARFRGEPIAESEWMLIDRSASHPFWAADGRLLYYTPVGTNPTIRSAIRARRFLEGSAGPSDESITVYSSAEMVMPAYLPGTAPVATPDDILLVLGDFRGDVWLMDL